MIAMKLINENYLSINVSERVDSAASVTNAMETTSAKALCVS